MLWEGATALDIIFTKRNVKWGRQRIQGIIGKTIHYPRYIPYGDWKKKAHMCSNKNGFISDPQQLYGLKGYTASFLIDGKPVPIIEEAVSRRATEYLSTSHYHHELNYHEVDHWVLHYGDKSIDLREKYLALDLVERYKLVCEGHIETRIKELIVRRKR